MATERYVYSRCCLLRSSLLPFDDFVAWGSALASGTSNNDTLAEAVLADTARLRERLAALWERPEVREAILVASPDLEREMPEWLGTPDSERGQKLERALVRYFSRMTLRATPFGTFAGVSPVVPAELTRLRLPGRAEYVRQTRVDFGYLCGLVRKLTQQEGIVDALRLRPNPTLYRIGERLRYTAVRFEGDRRLHHLVQLEPDSLVDGVLARARAGATLGELTAGVVDDTAPTAEPWTPEEARAYVTELLRGGALVHSLEPPVTGDEALEALTAKLSRIPAARGVFATLQGVASRLQLLDRSGVGAPLAIYQELFAMLGSADLDPASGVPNGAEARSHCLQVDLAKPTRSASIGRSVLAALDRGVAALQRITPQVDTSPLDEFRARFSARYEGREVALLEAVDEELGVGLHGAGRPGAAPLLEGLVFPGPVAAELVAWGPRERHLLNLLTAAERDGRREIALSEDDLAQMQAARPRALPDTRHVAFSIAAADESSVDRGEFRVWLMNTRGPSGAIVAGRFCRLLPEILDGVSEHLRREEALRPDAVFAELAHLPEGRVGNVASRPVLRRYEIPIATNSGVAEECRVELDDLTLRVAGGRLILSSRKLGREVLPRLTNAHNYGLGFSVYRFLCALQEPSGVGWSWGPLESARFLPRVSYGNIVFSVARWLLDKHDLAPLREASHGFRQAVTAAGLAELRARVFRAARALRERLGLPRVLLLVDEDNTLTLDFDNVLSVDSFAQLVRARDSVELRELWPDASELVVRGPEGGFYHELVAAVERVSPSMPAGAAAGAAASAARAAAPVPPDSLERTLVPGSGCAYLKLYTGTATGDLVLLQHVRPLAAALAAQGRFSSWYFVRYADPDPHLRLRFFGEPRALNEHVVPPLQDLARSLATRGLVWRIQQDTYEREVERYGGPAGMLLSEQLFAIDSDAILEALSRLEPARIAGARWLLALRGMDTLLASLGLALDHRLRVVTAARDGFGKEQGAGAAFYQQLGDSFRAQKQKIASIFEPNAAGPHAAACAAFDARRPQLEMVAARLHAVNDSLRVPRDELFMSYLHMHANRVLNTAARRQELVLYDFLRRYYQSRIAIERATGELAAR